MPNVKFEYPHVVAFEHPKDVAANTALSPQLTQKIEQFTLNGVVNKDGTWGVDENGFIHQPAGFTIDKITVGHYQVNHKQGYANLVLSVGLFGPGSVQILESSPTYFVIQTYLNGKETDMPFMFSLARTLPR